MDVCVYTLNAYTVWVHQPEDFEAKPGQAFPVTVVAGSAAGDAGKQRPGAVRLGESLVSHLSELKRLLRGIDVNVNLKLGDEYLSLGS